jgi:hypothetical protein
VSFATFDLHKRRIELQGILYDPIKNGVNLSNKLAPKSRHLPLVPSRGLPQVALGLSSY